MTLLLTASVAVAALALTNLAAKAAPADAPKTAGANRAADRWSEVQVPIRKKTPAAKKPVADEKLLLDRSL